MVAPLLGLLGTVYQYDRLVPKHGHRRHDKVKVLSEGIYEALVTTASGLTIQYPSSFSISG